MINKKNERKYKLGLILRLFLILVTISLGKIIVTTSVITTVQQRNTLFQKLENLNEAHDKLQFNIAKLTRELPIPSNMDVAQKFVRWE